MIGWREDSHLVTVDRVVVEESLNLLSYQSGRAMRPVEEEPLKHTEWAALADLAKPTELVEFIVCHPHINFIQLMRLNISLNKGSEFGGWLGPGYFGQHRDF